MMEQAPRAIDCLVLTPVGPGADPACVRDTVESFLHHMDVTRCVMAVLDDTRGGALAAALPSHPALRIVSAAPDRRGLAARLLRPRNTRGQLFVKQLLALRQLATAYNWRCLLRLDDDALIIGSNPHHHALARFAADSRLGMLGAYLRRGDGSDKQAAMADKGRLIEDQLRRADRGLHRALAEILQAADAHCYVRGHMCTGGAFFLSGAASAHVLASASPDLLGGAFLEDDLLFAMIVAAGGYRMADFCDDGDPMAINWRGLPMPPEALVARGRKVVHPVKDPRDSALERSVRAYFKALRNAD